MKQKQKWNLYETLFYEDVKQDLKTYNEDGHVPPLLNRLLEGIFVTLPNSGISKQINHEIECYFFNNHTPNHQMKLEQGYQDFTPDKLILKEKENTLKLTREQLTIKYRVSADTICKLKYTIKEPFQLTRTYYQKNKKRLKEESTIISFFDESGFEMRRLEEHLLMDVLGLLSKVQSKLSTMPTVEIKEITRDQENPELATVTTYQQYLDNLRQDGDLQKIEEETYFLPFENLENLDKLYRKTTDMSTKEKLAYYQAMKENYLYQTYLQKQEEKSKTKKKL